MTTSYDKERAYLKAVMAGDLKSASAILRRYPSFLQEEWTLVAPIYFRQRAIRDHVIARLIRAVEKHQIASFSLRRLIDWFGGARLTILEPDVMAFLGHPNAEIRWQALLVLGLSWDMRKHRVLYDRLLLRDPDSSVRGTAATSLGYVLRGTRDHRAVRHLLRLLRDKDETISVRHSAYEALFDLWGFERRRSLKLHLHLYDLSLKTHGDPAGWEANVDWALVAAFEHRAVPGRHPLIVSFRRLSTRRAVNRRPLRVSSYYAPIRTFLLAVQAGDMKGVRAVLRAHPGLINHDETLFAPVYFRRPDLAGYVADRVAKAIDAGRISTTGLYGLIHLFGETGLTRFESEVVRFLQHRSSRMRYIAVNVLSLHWGRRKWRQAYERLLSADPASDVRGLAVASLGYVLRETRDRRATWILARILRKRSEDWSVRQSAYEALLDLWFPAKRRTRESIRYTLGLKDKHREDLKAWEQWVDWGLVAALEKGHRPKAGAASPVHRTPSGR